MKTVLLRLLALIGALAAAVAVFVTAARLELGFWPLALLALVAFAGAGFGLLRATGGDRAEALRWLLGA